MVVGPEFGAWLAAKIDLSPAFAYTWPKIRWGVAVAFTVIGVEVLYFMAPNVKQRFFAAVPGATLAVAGWIGASYLLGVYVRKFAGFSQTYGTLGAVVALLTWFYWSNVIILLGAEINCELRKSCDRAPLPIKEEPPPAEDLE